MNKSQIGNYTIDKLNSETKEIIKLSFKNLMEKAKNLSNQTAIANYINNSQEKELSNLKLEVSYTDFLDILSKVNENNQTFFALVEERFTQERLLFSSNLDIFIIHIFNKSIETFLNGIGKEYYNSIFLSDYLSITHKFREISLNVNDTYNYMNALLDDTKAKMYSILLSKRLERIYGETRNEIKEIIEYKMNKIIYPKIEKFKNQILYFIPKNFLDKLSLQISSADMNKKLNKDKIYSLIKHNFTDGFRANLTSYLKDKLNKIIENEYIEKINNELNQLINIFTDYHIKIGKRTSSTSHTYSSGTMNSIITKFENLNKIVDNYDNFYSFNSNNSKMDLINEFFNINIIHEINSISENFEKEKERQNKNIEEEINKYEKIDLVSDLIKNISDSKININLIEIKDNIINQMNNLTSIFNDNIDSVKDYIKNYFKDRKLEGLKSIEKRRNLEENEFKYNSYPIYYPLNITEQKFNKFKEDILKNGNISLIQNKINEFTNQVKSKAENLTQYFLIYDILLSDYIDASKIINSMKTQCQKLKIFIIEYLINETKITNDVIQSITQKIKYNWFETRKKLDQSIAKILNNTFDDLFMNLTNYKYEGNEIKNLSNNNEYQNLNSPIYLYNDKNEIVLEINYLLDSIYVNYGFSIKLSDKYNFSVVNFINTNITGKFNIIFEDYILAQEYNGYQRMLNNLTYVLSDKSVEVNNYITQNPNKNFSFENNLEYQKENEEFNYNDGTLIQKISKIFRN